MAGQSASPAALPTSLDLDAIVAQGSIRLDEMPAEEAEAARRFWIRCRALNTQQAVIAASAADLVHSWTGCRAHDLGSFAIRLSLPSSDLDLGISHGGMPDTVQAALLPHATVVGEKETRSGGIRASFFFRHMGADIDVCVYDELDLADELRQLTQIRARLSADDAIAHLWIRQLLHQRQGRALYDAWKAATADKYTDPPSGDSQHAS